jgi:hypothetical protein
MGRQTTVQCGSSVDDDLRQRAIRAIRRMTPHIRKKAMTRYGNVFLVVAALVCAGHLTRGSAVSVARGDEGAGNRGGVLFYAGFDASVDADYAVGNPKNQAPEGGATINADGLGFRGAALRAGDGEGQVEYSAIDNIHAKQGTIEFWMYAQDWAKDDGDVHRFIDVRGEGNIDFRIRPPGVMEFLVRATNSPTSPSANTAYGSNPTKGKWSWFAITWQEGKPLGLYIGNISSAGKGRSHDCSPRAGETSVPDKLLKILIGDFGGRGGGGPTHSSTRSTSTTAR